MYKKNVQQAIDALHQTLVKLGSNPYRIDLPRPAGTMKMGADDFLVAHGKKGFQKLPEVPLFLSEGITGAALLQAKYEEPRWIIPGLLAEGLTLLAGKPKIGKSWLILNLLIAISSGKKALGWYEPRDGAVAAYLALEDTEVTLQKRLKDLGALPEDVKNIHFFFTWNRVEEDGLLAIERWLEQNPQCRIICIDTFAKVRSMPRTNNPYYEDYEAASELKKIADKFRIAIVVIHHVRKQKSDDPLDMISGTNGIAGSVDTNIILTRQRGVIDGIMYVTGRRFREQELAMKFGDCVWTVVGDAAHVQATQTQQEIILLLTDNGEPMTPTQIAQETGRSTGGISKTLRKMVNDGLLEKLTEKGKRGSYRPKPRKQPSEKFKGKQG